MSTKTITIILILLVLLGAGLYLTSDSSSQPAETIPDTTTSTSTPVSLGDIEAVATDINGATTTVILTPAPPASQIPKPIPSLTRSFVPPSPEFTAEAKKLLEDKHATYVATLKSDPTNVNAWIQIGILRRMVHDTTGTLEAWSYAARLSPKSAVVHKDLADFYMYDTHENAKSETEWKTAIALDPKDTFAYRGLFDLYTIAYTEKASLAPGVLMQGIAANPHDIDLMIPLAQYYAAHGNTARARTYYQNAIDEAHLRGNAKLEASLKAELSNL